MQPEMFNTEKYVIYKRVSGGHNQKSGLGLDAQSDEINAYLQAFKIVTGKHFWLHD